jgi:hypothetical protein
MQLLVKSFDACTHVVQAEEDAATVWDVKQKLQVRLFRQVGMQQTACRPGQEH